MKTENIIYHYCSLEAFHSIITTKSFWLFSLDSSNDLDETTKAKEIIDNVLKEEKYKSIKPNNSRQEEFYSLSCTHKRDSALHFNKYADNDKGVCFGIDTKVFNNTLQISSFFGYFYFLKVIYKDNQKEKDFFEALIDVSSEENKNRLRELTYISAISCFKPKLKIENYIDEAEIEKSAKRLAAKYYNAKT